MPHTKWVSRGGPQSPALNLWNIAGELITVIVKDPPPPAQPCPCNADRNGTDRSVLPKQAGRPARRVEKEE